MGRLVCFLVHAHDEGTLHEMGLMLSDDLAGRIMDVSEAEAWYGRPDLSINRGLGPVESAVENLMIELIRDANATCLHEPAP